MMHAPRPAHAPPGPGDPAATAAQAGRPVRLSLRGSLLLLVALINCLVFGAGGLYLFRVQLEQQEQQDDQRTQDILRAGAAVTIQPDKLNVAFILRWPYWEGVEDAWLVDTSLERGPSGEVDVAGLSLNPVGTGRRAWDFDDQAVLRALHLAIQNNEPVPGVEGGRVVPIASTRGDDAWGGVWYRTTNEVDRLGMAGRLLPWFLLSTLALTLVTFTVLRRLVVDPVAQLAEGARRVSAGDLSVRLIEPSRRDEITDLVRSFNEMTGTVQGFNRHLEEEVDRATGLARRAEAAAMTQRRLAAMGELAAGIAHEINNPLGGLQNAVVTLGREDLEPEKRRRYLRLLAEGLTRIGETVNRLRRFTPRQAQHDPVQLEDVVRDAVDLLRHRADRLGTNLGVHLPQGEVPEVLGARNEIGQAVLNLLSNALDALESDPRQPRESRIDVTLLPHTDGRGGVLLRVRDDGPGVDADELVRVQDLFYTTKEVGKGTGLGLPLVHSTLAQHGGGVEIRSRPGAFFEVELSFPSRAERQVTG